MTGDRTDHYAGLARSLTKHGVDEASSLYAAKGLVQAAREWCWANLTDVLGAREAVDSAVSSPLKPGVASRLLVLHKFLGVSKGMFFMPSAFTERPVYIDKRWRRISSESFELAKRRSKGELVGMNHKAVTVTEKPAGVKSKGQVGFVELRDYYCQQWSVLVGRGDKYPFSGADAKSIKALLDGTDNLDHAKRVVDNYLVCGDKFYAGKPLRKLAFQLPQFVAGAAAGGRRNGELEDPGAADIPTL